MAGNGTNSFWKRMYYFALCVSVGYIPEASASLNAMKNIIAVYRSQMGGEHSVPNQKSEIIHFMMKAQGADDNEIHAAIQELIPADQFASVAAVSVETVKENRQQVRESRKTTGMFSEETKAARKDLRQDRRASRRERRRGSRGSGRGRETVTAAMNFASKFG